MGHQRIERVVIVGGGTAGWMTALALTGMPPPHPAVTLVEAPEIGTVGVGEATLPTVRHFNQAVGIDEAAMLQAAQATFKLGVEFCD